MKRALVIRNVDIEGPGLLANWFTDAGWAPDLRRADCADPLPDHLDGHDGLIVLGGPMSVHDQAEYPHLARAEDLIRQAVATGIPTLGICLGAQLIAKAMGAEVRPNAVKEIGCYPVRLTDDAQRDPLFAGLGPEMTVFQWHGDTFTLPPGATLLAAAPLCHHQAFRIGANAYGLQFHMEVTADMVEAWAVAYQEELAAFNEMAPGDLCQAFAMAESEIRRTAAVVADNLVTLFSRAAVRGQT